MTNTIATVRFSANTIAGQHGSVSVESVRGRESTRYYLVVRYEGSLVNSEKRASMMMGSRKDDAMREAMRLAIQTFSGGAWDQV